MSPQDMSKENLRARLVGLLRYGGFMTVVFNTLDTDLASYFHPDFFPPEVISRETLYQESCWGTLLRKEEGDPEACDFLPRDDACLVLVVKEGPIPPEVQAQTAVIELKEEGEKANGWVHNLKMYYQTIALPSSVIRNSPELVEAAFDGEIEEVKKWLDKGFHVESKDGRGHTGVSEAGSQGHLEILRLLIDEHGANPNALNDSGRSALWRAAYNGHSEAVALLLEKGKSACAEFHHKDKISQEGAFDVAKTQDIRDILDAWDINRTVELKEIRDKMMKAKIDERVKTAVERDQRAKRIIRDELMEVTVKGDLPALKEALLGLAEEAELSGTRARATCEVRNDRGQTLLSVACQHHHTPIVEWLLTHHVSCDEDKFLDPGTSSWEARVTRPNVNSKDLKGWNVCAICVFAGAKSKGCLDLVLRHGGDPRVRSSYQKSAWDLSQDELDAAGRVVTSKAEIRSVIEEWEKENAPTPSPAAGPDPAENKESLEAQKV
ncbi:unnamed protein product [Chrysoparadoxa australica]